MTYAYMKPGNKKKMTTATNEACIGWLDENCYLKWKQWHLC